MEIKSINHKTINKIPKEVKAFFNEILSKHISELGEGQFIDKMNIGISMHRNEAIIETSSMDFVFNPKKGIEQFI
jgi:hypothetical protein